MHTKKWFTLTVYISFIISAFFFFYSVFVAFHMSAILTSTKRSSWATATHFSGTSLTSLVAFAILKILFKRWRQKNFRFFLDFFFNRQTIVIDVIYYETLYSHVGYIKFCNKSLQSDMLFIFF